MAPVLLYGQIRCGVVLDMYTIMQAAIKDVKGNFALKMQLAITYYLPGSYRL
jgi:hypothetical protein